MSEREDRLESIEARLAAATEGPWAWEVSDRSLLALGTAGTALFDGHVLSCVRCRACYEREPDGRCFWPEEANADFIAAAREDVPWLIEQLRAAWAELAELERSWADDRTR